MWSVSAYHFGGINTVCDSLYKFARFNSCCYGEGERSHTVIRQACCHKDMYTIARVAYVAASTSGTAAVSWLPNYPEYTHLLSHDFSFLLRFLWSPACYNPLYFPRTVWPLRQHYSIAPHSSRWPMTSFRTLPFCVLVKMHPLCNALLIGSKVFCVYATAEAKCIYRVELLSCAAVHWVDIITCVLRQWSPGTAQGHLTFQPNPCLAPDCVRSHLSACNIAAFSTSH